MGSFKKRIELGFETLTDRIITFRWVVIGLMIVLAVGAVRQLPNLTIDMSDEGFLHKDDPILQIYNNFRDQFGRDDLIVLSIESSRIFSRPFLANLKKLHEDLEENIPHLDEIISLINVRNTRGVADGIIVEDLLENWPADDQSLAELKNRVLAHPLYRDRLISRDGRFTTVIIKTDAYSTPAAGQEDILEGFDDPGPAGPDSETRVPADHAMSGRLYISEEERGAIVLAVKTIAEKYQAEDFTIRLAGSPVVTNVVKQAMRADLQLFLRLAVLVIAVCLLLMFRRISAVIYPLIVVILALVSTLAAMSVLEVAIKMPTMILPSFILAVGVGDSVHVLAIFFQNFARSGNKREALIKAMGHSGLAIIMTSLTTAAGLASFLTAKIAPVADLGIFASLGVMLSLVYTIFLLPALLAITPMRPRGSDLAFATEEGVSPGIMLAIMDGITEFSTRRSKLILVISLVILAVSLLGVSRLRFSHDILSWLPDDMPVKEATASIDRNLNGSVTLELVLDTGRENGLYDLDTLNKIDEFSRALLTDRSTDIGVGKVMSVVDIIKEIHQALHENRSEFYAIPLEDKLVPQEFLLFENSGSDDLEDVVDSRFQLARITVKVPWQDAMHYVPFIKHVEKQGREIFGDRMTITTTGIMALFGRIIYAAIYSASQSYMMAAAVITLMMILLVGSWRLGVASMLPNLIPVIATLGFMGWAGLPLDMFTMLIGSIAIGIAVDDTVHFIYNFRKYFVVSGDAVESVRQTLQTTGRAMLATTVVLSLGFFIFMFATMSNLFNFGMLTGIALILALVADFFMAPALFSLIAASEKGRAEILDR